MVYPAEQLLEHACELARSDPEPRRTGQLSGKLPDSPELDAAFASCPANQHIDIKSGETRGSGYCNITISAEETVFAEWSCSGKIGSCIGTFTLTGGTDPHAFVPGSMAH